MQFDEFLEMACQTFDDICQSLVKNRQTSVKNRQNVKTASNRQTLMSKAFDALTLPVKTVKEASKRRQTGVPRVF